MVSNTIKSINSDLLGAFSSGICLLHCIITPFIFLAQSASATHNTEVPSWWSAIDFVFIIISFFAVNASAKKSFKAWVKYTLWTSWILLSIAILNEKLGVLHLPELAVYIPAATLIIVHLYNKVYYNNKNQDFKTVN